jgi:uncharacterized protein YjdB
MKKHVWLIAAVTALMVLFAGCDNVDGITDTIKDKGDNSIPVSSIQILIGGQAASGSQTLTVGDEKVITVRILPNDTTEDKGYTLSIGNTSAEIATLDEDGTLRAVGKGAFTLTAASKGKNAQGSVVEARLQFTVKIDAEDKPLAFVVFDQKTGTSSALPSPNSDGRIEIFNEYADASFSGPGPGASTDTAGWVRNNTFVYLQRPLRIQPRAEVGPDEEAWVPYSIRARMRITETADGIANADNANMGVVIGIMTDPEDAAADARHYFVGLRSAMSGQKRGFRGRATDTSSGSLTSFVNPTLHPITSTTNAELAAELEKTDSVANKTAGYREQEYIYEVTRWRADFYLIRMYESNGTEIFTGRMDNSNKIATQMQETDAYLYLGFMVAGVKVEIANIEIKEGDEALAGFTAVAANPAPYVDVPNRVLITTPDFNPIIEDNVVQYNYTGPLAVLGNEGGHRLDAAVYPLAGGVSQDISWSSSDELVAMVDASGLVTFNAGGSVTITAASNADNSKTHSYRYYITDSNVEVETITITGDSEVLLGFDIKLEATVMPSYATNKDVTWSVKAGSESILSVDEEGWVQGLAVGTGYIIATADDGSGVIDEHEMKVLAIAGKTIHWNFQRVPEGFVAGNSNNADNAKDTKYGNNMTIHGDNTDGIRFVPAQSVSAHLAPLGFSTGYVSNNTNGKYITIAGMPEKFTIKVLAANNGNDGNTNKTLTAAVGEDEKTLQSFHGTANALADADEGTSVLEWEYEGDGGDLTLTVAGGGLRIFDVFITFDLIEE